MNETLSGPKPFTRVLVANRGEIAVRVIRACRDAGVVSIAVWAADDAEAVHVSLADIAVELKGDRPAETYLNIDQILSVALGADADAVHPGYGFLSENAQFARAVIGAGLIWIGPPPEAIETLGNKVAARRIAESVGAPLAPGTDGPVSTAAEVTAFAAQHGYPLTIKAAHGGGGRGMKIAYEGDDLSELFDSAVREATAAFGRGECFVERYLEDARHVEAQVLADNHGRVLVVGTRDCSLQRRNQKLVEEAPAPFLTAAQTALLTEASTNICRAAHYRGAGTVEFLLAADGTFSFLEVNTRLQVEHTVTEETTGLDLVREQFKIAAGSTLPEKAPPVTRHAIEFRINAEDPTRHFIPGSGTLETFRPPTGPGIRVDSGVERGTAVGDKYDSLLAKLIVVGTDRTQALERARRAFHEFEIGGVTTVLSFHRAVLEDPAFVATSVDNFTVHTRWIENVYSKRESPSPVEELRPPSVRIGGRWMNVSVPGLIGATGRLADVRDRTLLQSPTSEAERSEHVVAPMQGTLIKVSVVEGQHVSAGDLLVVVEAMKMENPVRAPHDGHIVNVTVREGDNVGQGEAICTVAQQGRQVRT